MDAFFKSRAYDLSTPRRCLFRMKRLFKFFLILILVSVGFELMCPVLSDSQVKLVGSINQAQTMSVAAPGEPRSTAPDFHAACEVEGHCHLGHCALLSSAAPGILRQSSDSFETVSLTAPRAPYISAIKRPPIAA